MIIASSSIKKEISIPLQMMSSSSAVQEPEDDMDDIVIINDRKIDKNDIINKVFGVNNAFSQVNEILSIKTKRKCFKSFIYNHTIFLYYQAWDEDFQSCITHLIELAEEKTGCNSFVIVIDKYQCKDKLSNILRAFMYLGFEMVHPSIYAQDSGYILVGYEL